LTATTDLGGFLWADVGGGSGSESRERGRAGAANSLFPRQEMRTMQMRDARGEAMKIWLTRIALAIALLSATNAFASLADIQTAKLPQTATVQRAYSDVLAAEPMVEQWTANWSYATPKAQVVSRLEADLSALQAAAPSAPGNEELLLLTGLAAHYAYNVDVASAGPVAIDSFENAGKIAPDDYRPEWFLGDHQCLASDIDTGMNKFLAVEQKFPSQSLPIEFWGDYMFCAYVANMPAHALRAAKILGSLNAPDSSTTDTIVTAAKSHLLPLDLSATIPAANIWESVAAGTNSVLTNFAFGVAVTIPASWQLKLSDVQQGICVGQFGTGPYQATTGQLYPTILIVSRQAKSGETLSDFANQFLQSNPFKPLPAGSCPFESCMAFEAVKPGAYGANGDGYAFAEVFQADAPAFPGLLFEQPAGPPSSTSSANGQPVFYRPQPRYLRADGTLYYLIMLDTAGSILPQAQQDYATFLKNLQVEDGR